MEADRSPQMPSKQHVGRGDAISTMPAMPMALWCTRRSYRWPPYRRRHDANGEDSQLKSISCRPTLLVRSMASRSAWFGPPRQDAICVRCNLSRVANSLGTTKVPQVCEASEAVRGELADAGPALYLGQCRRREASDLMGRSLPTSRRWCAPKPPRARSRTRFRPKTIQTGAIPARSRKSIRSSGHGREKLAIDTVLRALVDHASRTDPWHPRAHLDTVNA